MSTNTNTNTNTATVYVALWSRPGYLPETEPSYFLDLQDARDFLAESLEREANDSESGNRALSFANAANAIRKDTLGALVDGYVYEIIQASNAEALRDYCGQEDPGGDYDTTSLAELTEIIRGREAEGR